MVWYDLIRYCMCPFSRGALDVYEQGAINTTGCVSISAVAWRGNGLLFAMAGFLVDFFWLAIGSDGRIGNASAASVPQSHQQKLVSWHPKIYNNINLFSWDPIYIYIYTYIYNNTNSQLLNSEVFNLWSWLPPSKYRIYLLALLAGWNHTSKATWRHGFFSKQLLAWVYGKVS